MLSVRSAPTGHDLEHHCSAEYRGRLDVIPFQAWHLEFFQFRPEQRTVGVDLTPDYARALEQAGNGFSAWAGATLVAAAGVVVFWPGRAQVWGMFSDLMPQYGPLVHRHVLRYIQRCSVRRLECVVDPMFTKSIEWAVRLGFRFESTMTAYGVHGQDMLMYVRIR